MQMNLVNVQGMTTFVNFFCQSCLEPLKLDSTLLDINNNEFEQVASTVCGADSGEAIKNANAQPPKQKPSQLVITSIRFDEPNFLEMSLEVVLSNSAAGNVKKQH